MRYIIGTLSGSLYVVRQSGNRWFLSGQNKATEVSKALVGEIEIDMPTPWPPVIGSAIFLGTERPEGDKTRVRGKFTSPVESFAFTKEPA